MKDITVFFSWQSDLNPKETRYIIQEAIKAAKKHLKNIVTIESDRDTKGQTGSPNIEEVIFNKIKNCDIFIADVSIVNKYTAVPPTSSDEGELIEVTDESGEKDSNEHRIRYTPNPNVMEELGYAAAIVGWNNVICVMNTDYGKKEDLPFDLAHHRITDYSLKDDAKADVIKELRDCIIGHVLEILEHGARQKGTSADHIVGYYDFSTHNVLEKLIAFEITDQPFIESYKHEKSRVILSLIDEIKSIPVPVNASVNEETDKGNYLPDMSEHQPSIDIKNLMRPDYLKSLNHYSKLISIDTEDRKLIELYAGKVLNQVLDDQFFSLGNMHENPFHIAGISKRYEASPDEERKYRALLQLVDEIVNIRILDMYIETFMNMKFYPLAICNKSKNADQHLTVSIKIENGRAITPSKDLIVESMKHKYEGRIHDLGIVKGIFGLPETGEISDNTEHEIVMPRIKGIEGDALGGFHLAESDEDDYEDEIKEYILTPINGSNEYRVNVSSLRPDEKSWLGIIALHDDEVTPVVRYKVWSENTDGSVEGTIQ